MRVLGQSCAVGDPAHAGKFPAQKLGDLRRARRDDAGQFREGQEPHAWTIIGGEVGCAHSTWEAIEQGQPARGDGGGKERSQGERWTGPRTPDTEPDQLCVDGPGRRTSGSAPESAAAVHGAATCGQLLQPPEERGGGGGWSDVAGVREDSPSAGGRAWPSP